MSFQAIICSHRSKRLSVSTPLNLCSLPAAGPGHRCPLRHHHHGLLGDRTRWSPNGVRHPARGEKTIWSHFPCDTSPSIACCSCEVAPFICGVMTRSPQALQTRCARLELSWHSCKLRLSGKIPCSGWQHQRRLSCCWRSSPSPFLPCPAVQTFSPKSAHPCSHPCPRSRDWGAGFTPWTTREVDVWDSGFPFAGWL